MSLIALSPRNLASSFFCNRSDQAFGPASRAELPWTMDKTLPSKLLDKLRPNLDAERQLKELLVTRARSYAARIIGVDMEKRVSATEVACSAANSLMSDVKHGRFEPVDSGQLFALLLFRTKNKAKDTIRKATAARRDVGREDGDVTRAGANNDTPEMLAAANEVGQRLATLLCQTDNEVKRCVNLLGILGEYSAPAIRDALLPQDWLKVEDVPSARTIQLWLASERERIGKAFGVDDGE